MPYTDNLPPENTDPWYAGLVTAWSSLKTFVNGLETAIALKAADSAVVKLTGDQAVAGVKTFSTAPTVPDAAFPTAKISGLDTALAAKADDAAVVKLTGAQAIGGVKTFGSSPVVPTPTTSTQAAPKGYVDTTVAAAIAAIPPSSGGTTTPYVPPAPIGTLYRWHRTSLVDGSGNYLADGTALTSIAPTVGAVSLTAPGASGTRPTVTTINSRKHWVVDGVDDYIDAAIGEIPQPFGLLMVGQYMGPIDTTTNRRYMGATVSGRASLFQPTGVNYLRAYGGNGSNMNIANVTVDNNRHMIFMCLDDTSSVAGRDLTRTGWFNVSTLWAATTAYTVGTERYVTGSNRVYRCISAGTSGSTAPSAQTEAVTDGTVIWKYLGQRASGSAGAFSLEGLRLGANSLLAEFTNVAYEDVCVGTFTADDVEAWYRDLDVAAYYGW